jgi:hypothetical protein
MDEYVFVVYSGCELHPIIGIFSNQDSARDCKSAYQRDLEKMNKVSSMVCMQPFKLHGEFSKNT